MDRTLASEAEDVSSILTGDTMDILLTGDDGYNSIGTRILISLLKDKHDLTIVGVKDQQSGVGGKLSVQKDGRWQETVIDGTQAFFVDGTPADAMEFAHSRLAKKYNWLLSGVNLGANVTTAIISSGTVGAAIRGLGLGLATKAIALSWETPPEYYFLKHDERENISRYLEHPGESVGKILSLCFKNNNYGTNFLNVNIPSIQSSRVRFTKMFPDSSKLYPPIIVRDDGSYAFPPEVEEASGVPVEYDVGAMKRGENSISPLTTDWTNMKAYTNIQIKELQL